MSNQGAVERGRPNTIALAGDVMLGRLVNDAMAEHGWPHPWGNVTPLLWQADAFLINLECAITARVVRWHDGHYKPFHFRADPGAIESLRMARVDCASIANNHILDFGPEGLLDTIHALDAAGIAHAGAGRDEQAARAPALVTTRHGVRIAVVAFADYPASWAATADSPGLNFMPVSVEPAALARITEAIAEARSLADLVVFSIHWGPNMRSHATPEFRAFARRVIGAGADLFWGHSAHVAQGIELFQGRPILYDTGDFVDDYAVNAALRNDLSALFLLEVAPPHVERIHLVPVHVGHMQVNLATGGDRRWIANRLVRLCEEMGTEVTDVGGGLTIDVHARMHETARAD
jgi:poly-gamma-glutamate synthesis protein (capsule biosynthesis protein)